MVVRRRRKIVINTLVSILVVALVVVIFNYLFFKEGFREGYYKGSMELGEFRRSYRSAILGGKKYYFVVNFKKAEKGKEEVLLMPFNCSTMTLSWEEERQLDALLSKIPVQKRLE